MIRLLSSMPNSSQIVVVSRTFTNTPELVSELSQHFTHITWNPDKKLSGDALASFIGDAKGAIIALEEIDDHILSQCPNLEIIGKFGVGLDNLNIDACRAHNVKIGWTGGVNRLSVAEMALSFMISLSRNLTSSSIQLKRGLWNKDGGVNLSGRTIGIIGVGNVGKEVIRLLKPFGCRILVNDIIDQKEYYLREGVEEVGKDEIFTNADMITLHIPSTPDTENIVNEHSIGLMKENACIINTARGPLVDYTALKKALQTKKIAGAGIDVYEEEPPQDSELLNLENLICTPHIGGNSKESVLAMGMSAIEHLKEHFLKRAT